MWCAYVSLGTKGIVYLLIPIMVYLLFSQSTGSNEPEKEELVPHCSSLHALEHTDLLLLLCLLCDQGEVE